MAEDIGNFLVKYLIDGEIYVLKYDGESTYFTSKVEAQKYLLLLIDRDFSGVDNYFNSAFMKNIYNPDDALNIKLDKIKQKLIELRNSGIIKVKSNLGYSIEYNDDKFRRLKHYVEYDDTLMSNQINMAQILTIKIHHNLSSALESTNFYDEIANPKKHGFPT